MAKKKYTKVTKKELAGLTKQALKEKIRSAAKTANSRIRRGGEKAAPNQPEWLTEKGYFPTGLRSGSAKELQSLYTDIRSYLAGNKPPKTPEEQLRGKINRLRREANKRLDELANAGYKDSMLMLDKYRNMEYKWFGDEYGHFRTPDKNMTLDELKLLYDNIADFLERDYSKKTFDDIIKKFAENRDITNDLSNRYFDILERAENLGYTKEYVYSKEDEIIERIDHGFSDEEIFQMLKEGLDEWEEEQQKEKERFAQKNKKRRYKKRK